MRFQLAIFNIDILVGKNGMPYPGVQELVKTLKNAGCHTAIIGHMQTDKVQALAVKYFRDQLDIVLGSASESEAADSDCSTLIRQIRESLQISADNSVYISGPDAAISTLISSGINLIAADWNGSDRTLLQNQGAATIISHPYEIEKLIMTDMSSVKKVICPNCGAEFEDNRDRCPYCQTIYEPGAERQYMHKLDKLRDELDDLDNNAIRETARETARTTGKLLKILGIIIAVILALVGICLAIEKISDYYYMKSNQEYEEKSAEWAEANQEDWNALYDAGKYDELYDEYIEQSNNDEAVWSSDHYDFLSTVETIRMFQYYYDEYAIDGYITKNTLSLMLYYSVNLWANETDNSFLRLTADEQTYISEEYNTGREEALDLFQMTPSDLMQFAFDDHTPTFADWSKIDDYVDDNWDKWK